MNAYQAVGDNSFCTSFFSPCNGDAFVTKIDSSGSTIIFSTFLGGSAADQGMGIAVDGSSPANVYVIGQTTSTDFPAVNPLPAPNDALQGSADAFVSKISGLALPAVAFFPTLLDFPGVVVGTTSSSQPVTIKNVGDAPLTISNIIAAAFSAGSPTANLIRPTIAPPFSRLGQPAPPTSPLRPTTVLARVETSTFSMTPPGARKQCR